MKSDTKRTKKLLELIGELPEVVIEEAEGHLGFSVRKKRFAWHLVDHHGDGVVSLSCKAAPGVNRELAEQFPDRFFIPAYTGNRGWVGLRLDLHVIDWKEVRGLLVESYRLIAPKSLSCKVS